jgi:hypothetical protein
VGVALLGVPAARAGHIPLPPVEQQLVNQAIDVGVDYLSKNQTETGVWAKDDGHPIGYSAFPGLTLLACGVPASDPVIQKAALYVRRKTADLTNTYELSLAILFLDRLGDRKDRPLIQKLALRIIGSQTPTGGWLYTCKVLTPADQNQLLAALRGKKFFKGSLPVLRDPSTLPQVEDPKAKEPMWGTTDNSCTQFATLAVWVARRHKIPVDRTLRLITRRFASSQSQGGGWVYGYTPGGGPAETKEFICAGLLGLALGHKVEKEAAPKGKALFLAAGQALADVAFPSNSSRVAAVALADQVWKALQGEKIKADDPKITKGMTALAKYVGQPTGRMKDLPMPNLYFLWTVERAAVVFGLQTIGGKDWYRWGAEQLVANQKLDGHWEKGIYTGSTDTIDTCLALLFLKRANLASGLSPGITVQPKETVKPVVVVPPPTEKKAVPVIPTPVDEPKVRETPTEEPVKQQTAPPPAPVEEKKEPGGIPWLLILGGAGVLVLLGAALFLLLKKKARAKAEEDNDLDDEDEPAPVFKKKKANVVMDNDEEVDEPAPPRKKAKAVLDDEPEPNDDDLPRSQLKPKKKRL